MVKDQKIALSSSATLPLLRTFEVAARYKSFIKAAGELNITASAVSQQMRLLESRLGAGLFDRSPNGIEITSAGERLSRELAPALRAIERAVARVADHQATGKLTVSVLGSFALEWLMPRLPGFRRLHPGVELVLCSDQRPVDLRKREADLAIRFGAGQYPGLWSERLMGDRVFPVCAPALIANAPNLSLEALVSSLPLIHDESVGELDPSLAWAKWFIEGQVIQKTLWLYFSDAVLCLRAALRGEGVMLARASIAAGYIATGSLVRPVASTRKTESSYYIIAGPQGPVGPAEVFCAWLRQVAEAGPPVWNQRGVGFERV